MLRGRPSLRAASLTLPRQASTVRAASQALGRAGCPERSRTAVATWVSSMTLPTPAASAAWSSVLRSSLTLPRCSHAASARSAELDSKLESIPRLFPRYRASAGRSERRSLKGGTRTTQTAMR